MASSLHLRAIEVALSRIGNVQARPIIVERGGIKKLKTLVVCAAVGAGLRESLDAGVFVAKGEDFITIKDVVINLFPPTISSCLSKLEPGEVHASCPLLIFVPKDVVTIDRKIVQKSVSLSIERLIYEDFLLALDHYFEYDDGDLDRLVIAVDAVYAATKKVCIEVSKHLETFKRARELK